MCSPGKYQSLPASIGPVTTGRASTMLQAATAASAELLCITCPGLSSLQVFSTKTHQYHCIVYMHHCGHGHRPHHCLACFSRQSLSSSFAFCRKSFCRKSALLLLFTFAHTQAAIDAARSMQPHVTPPFVTTRDILYAIYSTVH